MLDKGYVLDEPDIVSESFDGEYVILNLSNGTYYSLEGGGNALWAAMMEGAPPATILAAMDAAGNAQTAAASAFFEKVVELGLVRPADPAGTTALSADLLEHLAMIDAPPAVEVFEDLADLILADPVHDTDEQAGWPVARPDA